MVGPSLNDVVHLIIWFELHELFLILVAALTSRMYHQSELFGTLAPPLQKCQRFLKSQGKLRRKSCSGKRDTKDFSAG